MIANQNIHQTRSVSSPGSDHLNPLTPNSRRRTLALTMSCAANPSGSKTLVTLLVRLIRVYSSSFMLSTRKPSVSSRVFHTTPSTFLLPSSIKRTSGEIGFFSPLHHSNKFFGIRDRTLKCKSASASAFRTTDASFNPSLTFLADPR